MDPDEVKIIIDIGVGAAILGAISLLVGPTHLDRFRGTCAAVVLGVFQMDPGFRDEAAMQIAIAVISGLVGFIKFIGSKK